MVKPMRTIGDHGIIGDMKTAALVALDGTIDYLCWPSLDSPTIFAELLDDEKGGAFSIEPDLQDVRPLQLYHPDTNVLITRFMAEGGSAEILDLMPHPDARAHGESTACRVIRKVTVTRGKVSFRARCAPRFDYAREVPSAEPGANGVRFTGRELALRLFASVPLACTDGEATAAFTCRREKARGSCWETTRWRSATAMR